MKAYLKKVYRKFLNLKTDIKNNLFGDKNYKKFVIISRSRTGSTLLMALLNEHSNIICEGELFKVLNGKSCKQIWDGFYGKKPKSIKQVGFKLFYYHPFDDDKEVWDFMKNEKDITIIHLVRKNMLRAFASQKIGEKTKKWTENVNRPHQLEINNKKILLDYDECLQTFVKIDDYEEKTRADFSGYNYVEVSYESLSSNKEEVLENVFEVLKVPNEKVSTVMKKQNPEALEELIENYNLLKEKFKNSKWEYLFEA